MGHSSSCKQARDSIESLKTTASQAGKPTAHLMCVAVCAREAGSQLLRLNELLELAQIHIIIGIQACSMHAQSVKLIYDNASSICLFSLQEHWQIEHDICAGLLLPIGCACCLQRCAGGAHSYCDASTPVGAK